jgi:Cu+-exporting ATPase
MHALQPMILDRQLTVVKPLDFPTNNILQVEYIPSCDVNIRTIIRAVASSKPSEGSQFQVSIFKPPTLEERARHMYQREQRMLLHRLLFAVVTAIPTFIIGIVYMSLLPRKNATRMWFMSTLWIGRTSRLNWALFFLATPVYFYSCGIFHRRQVITVFPSDPG